MKQKTEGHYDKECEEILRKVNADLVLLSVIGGDRGHGFSVDMPIEMLHLKEKLPEILRLMADDIEKKMLEENKNTHEDTDIFGSI